MCIKLKEHQLGFNWNLLVRLGYNTAFRIKWFCPTCGHQDYIHMFNPENMRKMIINTEIIHCHCRGCNNISPIKLNINMESEEYTNGGR